MPHAAGMLPRLGRRRISSVADLVFAFVITGPHCIGFSKFRPSLGRDGESALDAFVHFLYSREFWPSPGFCRSFLSVLLRIVENLVTIGIDDGATADLLDRAAL